MQEIRKVESIDDHSSSDSLNDTKISTFTKLKNAFKCIYLRYYLLTGQSFFKSSHYACILPDFSFPLINFVYRWQSISLSDRRTT